MLAVEYELVPVEAKVAGDFLSEKYEREDVSELQSVISTPISRQLHVAGTAPASIHSYLFAVLCKELVWICAV